MSKSNVGRKIVSAKLTNWVQPAFDDFLSDSTITSVTSHGKPSGHSLSSNGGQKIFQPERDKRSKFFPLNSTKNRKRTKTTNKGLLNYRKSNPPSNRTEPWVDEYIPRTQSELAVHKKKIEEVENWLKVHIRQRCHQDGSILLLTGPSGAGKTATLQVLVKELEIQLLEWTNPLQNEFKKPEFRDSFDIDSSFQQYTSTSQSVLFHEFLLRANKYNKLQMLGDSFQTDKKVILVEDIPNQFYRDPSCMHEVLRRRFVQTARCPLVFIISDSVSGSSNQRFLFPKDIQEELCIYNISFNPVAPTNMMKVLNRIASQESGGKTVAPDKAMLELVCQGSAGDIRCAINSLQFASAQGSSLEQNQLSFSKRKILAKAGTFSKGKLKGKASEKGDCLQAIGNKDPCLFLFRALGKILYCKREAPNGVDLNDLPTHLSEHERDPLLVNPEEVIENSHMSAELFNLYLHQNYLDFFKEIEDVVRASDYLSDANFLIADWNHHSTMMTYSASVATRGIIHANTARARANCQGGIGFKPFHKPQWLLINKKYHENCNAAKGFFSNFCLAPICLQTQLLPYLALLTNPMRNQAQINFIQDVGTFPFKRYPARLTLETLTDKDPGIMELDNDENFSLATSSVGMETQNSAVSASQTGSGDLPNSQPQPTITQSILEEEFIIEEYDSD
ncbi:cell cycle checkpoint protein RAD17 isoform X1 [Callorhinchus milii]|uniref:cell cycle checkpoint protein RAD17 isoform X1 n=1 Tax=Callorhinchus milii TaxID=7868 RepID=UPI000457285C|nr:cell cycle checkpoint protein RAD17 isoform X1 [Callorhinchus milii]|eukprot:gi/632963589/ref/XP_007897969.1/ PREDICTED: cell cycle checkpoint protein RAD17 isoform X1 [Callorhinchus milii]